MIYIRPLGSTLYICKVIFLGDLAWNGRGCQADVCVRARLSVAEMRVYLDELGGAEAAKPEEAALGGAFP